MNDGAARSTRASTRVVAGADDPGRDAAPPPGDEHAPPPRAKEGERGYTPRNPDRNPDQPDIDPEDATTRPRRSYRHTDVGNATRFIDRHGRNFKWCAVLPNDGVLWWDGNRWIGDALKRTKKAAHAVARDILADLADTQAELARLQRMSSGDLIPDNPLTLQPRIAAITAQIKPLQQWARQSEMSPTLNAMVAESLHQVAVQHAELDADHMMFNTRGGTLDLRNGEIHPCRREDNITKLAECRADGAAECPTWIAFLTKIMGGDRDPAGAAEMVAFLQRVAGYCLTGSIKEQCMFILYGNGANGKSTFLDTVRAVFGEYAQHARSQTFMKKDENAIPVGVAALRGARLVTSSEPDQNAALDESLIKEMSGDNALTARFMRQDEFTFTPTFKVLLATNHLPRITGTDKGIWRRIRLIPFEVTIKDEEKIADLDQKLLAERDGILRWAIHGCGDWLFGELPSAAHPLGLPPGLRPPARVTAATAQYRTDMDVLGDFLAERCVVDTPAQVEEGRRRTVTSNALYQAFKAWCLDNGIGGGRPKNSKWVLHQMKGKGFTLTVDSNERSPRWEGVDLIEQTPPPFGGYGHRPARGEA